MPTKRFHSAGASGGFGPGRMECCVGFAVWAGRPRANKLKQMSNTRLGRQRKVRVTVRMITDAARPRKTSPLRMCNPQTKRGRSELRPYNCELLLFGGGGGFVQAGGHDWVEEGHHRAQLQADLLDLLLLLGFAARQEIRAALFVFFNPCLRKTAVADAREQLLHLLARLLGHNALPGVIIA